MEAIRSIRAPLQPTTIAGHKNVSTTAQFGQFISSLELCQVMLISAKIPGSGK